MARAKGIALPSNGSYPWHKLRMPSRRAENQHVPEPVRMGFDYARPEGLKVRTVRRKLCRTVPKGMLTGVVTARSKSSSMAMMYSLEAVPSNM